MHSMSLVRDRRGTGAFDAHRGRETVAGVEKTARRGDDCDEMKTGVWRHCDAFAALVTDRDRRLPRSRHTPTRRSAAIYGFSSRHFVSTVYSAGRNHRQLIIKGVREGFRAAGIVIPARVSVMVLATMMQKRAMPVRRRRRPPRHVEKRDPRDG